MKRILSILMVIALVFTMISGCGKNSSEKSASKDTISEVKVTFPCSTGIKATVEGEAVIATQVYLLARAYFEKLEMYDMDSFDADEYSKLLAEALESFRIAESLSKSFEQHANALIELEEDESYQSEKATYEQVSAAFESSSFSPLTIVAYAAEEKSPAVKYAEELTKTFDNAKNGQKLKAIAEKYGTDVKKAKAMLDQAQAILEGSAYADQADFENKCYEFAVETKAAASTIGFGVAVAASGGIAAGGASVAGLMEAGGLVFNGVSAIIDTGTAITIHTTNGEGNDYTAAFEATGELLAPVSAVFAIGGGIQNIKDFRDPEKALDAVNNAAQAFLTGVGFARDYVQDGTVLGVSSRIIDGYKEIIVRSADTSNPDAVKEVLVKTGISEDTLEESDGKDTAATDQPAKQQEGHLGAAADTYIEAMGNLADPENPVNIEAIIEKLDGAFPENAQVKGTGENVKQEETLEEDVAEVIEAEDTSDQQNNSEDVSGVYAVTELRFVQANIAAPLDDRLHVTVSGTDITIEGETEFIERISGTYDAQTMTATFDGDQSKMTVTFDGKGNLLYSAYNTNDGLLYIEIDASK